MKKILIVAMLCLMSAVTFGKEVKVKSEESSKENSLIMADFLEKYMFCTVTVNIHWYNSYGAYVGTTSATRSASGQFGCTLAYMMAKDAASELQPQEALEPIEVGPLEPGVDEPEVPAEPGVDIP